MAATQGLAARRFAEADANAERLLGFVRMAVALVLALAVLFAAMSDDRPESALLDRQIIYAVSGMFCYFLVGLAAVALVGAGRHAPWIAWATAAADVGLIAGNIFSTVHFGQLNSLVALAFPAATMLPLVLSFGALRFRPGVQLTATLAAGVVLALIVFSDTRIDADMTAAMAQVRLTYGVPPNMIRILILVGVGLVIALAVLRARRLLERVVAEAEARANLTRFLPGGVAEEMSDAALARLRAGRRATLGLLFIDIRAFTALSEGREPEEVSRILSDFRAAVLDVAQAHGGVVDKFIGDGAFLLFGLDGGPRDAARAALRAAEMIAARFAEGDFRIGVGVHLGEVFVGAVGDERRLEFTVIGAEANLASRIEDMTKTEATTALASAAVIEMAEDAPRWRLVGEREVRGMDRPVAIWALPETGATP